MSVEHSHQRVFYESALPSIFHATPKDFLFYLDRDGNKFLQFYWEQVGKSLGNSDRADGYGLNYIVRKPEKSVTVAMVLLPAPQVTAEAYFEAFIYRPCRVTPILRISDMTAIFAQTLISSDGKIPRTNIIECTRKEQIINHGPGPEPVVEEFYLAVLELIRDSRGSL
jgi:hypothetical protein